MQAKVAVIEHFSQKLFQLGIKKIYIPHIFRELGLHAVLVTKQVMKPLIKMLKIIK